MRHVWTIFAWIAWPAASFLGSLSTWPGSLAAVVAWIALALLPALGLTLHRAGPIGAVRRRRFAIFLGAVGAAYIACVVVGRYWQFYHLTTPMSGLLLLLIVFPALALIGAGVGLEAAGPTVSGGELVARHSQPQISRATAAILAVMVVAVALEIWSTTELRSGEGEGAGDLKPFAASLFRRCERGASCR